MITIVWKWKTSYNIFFLRGWNWPNRIKKTPSCSVKTALKCIYKCIILYPLSEWMVRTCKSELLLTWYHDEKMPHFTYTCVNQIYFHVNINNYVSCCCMHNMELIYIHSLLAVSVTLLRFQNSSLPRHQHIFMKFHPTIKQL